MSRVESTHTAQATELGREIVDRTFKILRETCPANFISDRRGGFDIVSLSLFAVFFGLDFVATVPPTVKLTGLFFEPAKAPIIFGWAFASHQVGGATAAFATGVSRDMLATYVPAFFAAGIICLIAATVVMVLRSPQHSGGARSLVGLRT